MFRVGILGATGAVGQRFVQLLDGHPDFELVALTASEESAGSSYRAAAKWRVSTPIPEDVASMTVTATEPEAVPDDLDLLFSSLPSGVAERVEPAFLEAGYVVSSNSSNARLDDDVPLVIPEVNPDHLDLIEVQREERDWDGALIKNPNCSTITMVPALAALDQFGIERVNVSTLQAVSGAGYSGVTSMEIIDNAIPYIGGEEEKMETESRKLLGTVGDGGVDWHEASVSASCNRIATIDGHLENVFVETDADPSTEEIAEAFRAAASQDLPTAPDPLIEVFDEPDRPQPRLDRMVGDGMAIAVGGIQQNDDGFQFNVLSHNTIRGAAGASVLNGELLADRGWL
ncbi:aspartate-semialdehyde dehydrogenase [Halanaeroarchaeum sulfurireducens]|uniref:Aspartate-semialdehyde dehydrogenase n=1 Tax=Halanaeroarchaeum sulfurireducens TaxID=1604004 RepID=A0A0F7PAH2_9EURY|nr:aspartate-semialdehyde dehydrogenase [Halanaeroarchaeum sulfurireducens]AKH98161.1 aspartate-semialdehyde dehydrogenase [Halanaeroarchaeum sulfurireducens]ALG82555.1 aspartate-semialdehyde dehydrogenase [Halanaeroarchaeum sulfurireducens]